MKYELTGETLETWAGTLRRIRALKDFGEVKTGDIGGFIQVEANLSQDGEAWVSGEAWVFGEAQVFGEAWVSGKAWVCSFAKVDFDTSAVPYIVVGPFGEHQRHITITQTHIYAGCFKGLLVDFKDAVIDKYGDDFGSYANAVHIAQLFQSSYNATTTQSDAGR